MLKKIVMFLTTLLSSLSSSNRGLYTQQYVIDDSLNPAYIYWIDNSNILISDYEESFKYNLLTKEKEILKKGLVGYDNGEFVLCEYENLDINSMDESSTFITVKDLDDNTLYNLSMFPTVKPVVCTPEYVIAKSSFSFLEDMHIIANVKTGEYKPFELEKRDLEFEGIENYKRVSVSKDNRSLIILDEFNRLVYYKEE